MPTGLPAPRFGTPGSPLTWSAGLNVKSSTTASAVVTSAIAPRLGTRENPPLVRKSFGVYLTVRDIEFAQVSAHRLHHRIGPTNEDVAQADVRDELGYRAGVERAMAAARLALADQGVDLDVIRLGELLDLLAEDHVLPAASAVQDHDRDVSAAELLE